MGRGIIRLISIIIVSSLLISPGCSGGEEQDNVKQQVIQLQQELADLQREVGILKDNPKETSRNHLTVAPSGGNFTRLSDALKSITDASATNRYVISVFGRINDTSTPVAKSYVDVIGLGADVIVSSTSNITGADFNSVVECSWRSITVRRQGTVPDGTSCARFRGTTDKTCRIEQCRFLNETSGGSNCPGIDILDSASPSGEFVGTGGNGGTDCMGIDINGTASPTGIFRGTGGSFVEAYPFCVGIRIGESATPSGEFYGEGGSGGGRNVGINICNQARPSGTFTGTGGNGGHACFGVRIVDEATPYGKFFGYGGDGGDACIGLIMRINSTASGEFFGIGGGGGQEGQGIRMSHATAWRGKAVGIGGGKPSSHYWEYKAASNGRFQPYAGKPYQLIAMWVDVKTATEGAKLSLGTTAGGSEIVSGIDLGTTRDGQYRYFNPVRVEVAANNYIYATTSLPVADGSFTVRYTFITNFPLSEGLRLETQGYAVFSNSLFLANGASNAVAIDAPAIDNKNWQIRNSHLETYDPANQSAVYAQSMITDAPISGCTFKGLLTNIASFETETNSKEP